MSATLVALIQEAAAALESAGIDDARREARLIAAAALGVEPGRLILIERDPVAADAEARLRAMLSERQARKPLAQVLGRRAFFRHEFLVTDQVLDPRPETETLVEAALAQPAEQVLDLGTGSGAILLSVLAEMPGARGLGTDLSEAALAVAAENARRLGLETRARFRRSDWFAQVEGSYDLILSNPPYIAAEEMAALAPELHHEPRMALTDEGDGLSAYRVLTAEAGAYLRPGGRLMVEIGWTQARAVRAMFEAAGFTGIRVLPDLDGRDRVLCGIWP